MIAGGACTHSVGAPVTTLPIPSTWPCTRWPPRRSASRSGRSRLTGSPGRRSARLVRESDSSTTSASHQPSPTSTTVTQHPLAAIESPTFASWVTSVAAKRKRLPSRAASVPSSSTIPVNIVLGPGGAPTPPPRRAGGPLPGRRGRGNQLDPEVVPQAFDGHDAAAPDVSHRCRARAGEHRAGVVTAEQRRRHVEDVAVDEAGAVKGPGHAPPALHEHL